MAKQQSGSNSTLCKICTRKVRYDNPTFPYCNYHAGMKEYETLTDKNFREATTQEERDRVYRDRYIPDYSYTSPRVAALSLVENSVNGIEPKLIKATENLWKKKTRKVNMLVPSQSYEIRDDILGTLNEKLQKNNDVEIIEMKSGEILFGEEDANLLGKKILNTADHNSLLLTNSKGSFVIDVATSAPLHNIVNEGESILKYFPSGTSLGDGLNFSHIAEAAFFSDIKWGLIETQSGNTIWDARDSETSDIAKQRKLVASSPKLERRNIQVYTANVRYEDTNDVMDIDELVLADREGRL